MSRFNLKPNFSYRDLLYKVLIFIATVAVITYFMPRDGKFNYQFDIGTPWKYGQLIATFDFPIYKDEQIVKHEQDSILATFQPYYLLDKKVGDSLFAEAAHRLPARAATAIAPPQTTLQHIERKLSDIYNTGIMPTDTLKALRQDSTVGIMVIDDKLAKLLSAGTSLFRQDRLHLPVARRHDRPSALTSCAVVRLTTTCRPT